MKAAIYPGAGQPVVIEDLPDPEPGPGEIVIKVHRCCVCGTDLAMTRGGTWDYGPGQFGHEYAGEIVALGRDLENFRIGEKIAVVPSGACGHCLACREGGNHVMCRNAPGASHGFAEFASLPADLAVRLPQTISLADGALIEPLAISLYGVRQSRIRPGDKVLVLGGGTVALYAILWARRLGAGRIVAASRSARRRDLCLELGADAFVTFGAAEAGEVAEALGGAPDVVFECVGVAGMLDKAILHAKIYGTVVSLGFCTHPDPIMPAMAAYKCITVQFRVGYTKQEFLFIADQLDQDRLAGGQPDPKVIITREIPLIELPATMEMLRGPNSETKVHVR